MKNNKMLINGVLLGIFFFGLYACSKQVEIFDDKEMICKSNYELVGSLHNEGVEYVFQQLVSKKTKSIYSKKSDVGYIYDLCRIFVEQRGYKTKEMVNTRAKNPIMDYRQIEFEFSENQNYYLNRLKEIIDNSTITRITALVQEIKELEEEMRADAKMVDYEKEVLLYGLAVCRYSAKYWSENYEKWIFEFNNISNYPRTKSAQEHVVSQSWWDKNKHIVTADGWWAMQGFLQSTSSVAPWYIIGVTVCEGVAGSVLAVLGE